MDLFIRDIQDFIKCQRPKIGLKPYGVSRDIFELPSHQGFNPILLVFHHLNESSASHLKKISDLTSNEEYLVIHLWEDWWKFYSEKVKSRINSLLGNSIRIHGRETIIKGINNDELISFLDRNHLHIPIKAKYKYGLFFNEELESVMSFSKGRPMNRDEVIYDSYELLRFCNKLNHTVVGGFTKLLNHFIQSVSPDDIMTYVDMDWSDGTTYEMAGFMLQGQLPPMEFLLDMSTGKRIYPGEKQLLQSASIKKVYNSGSYKYIKKIK